METQTFLQNTKDFWVRDRAGENRPGDILNFNPVKLRKIPRKTEKKQLKPLKTKRPSSDTFHIARYFQR